MLFFQVLLKSFLFIGYIFNLGFELAYFQVWFYCFHLDRIIMESLSHMAIYFFLTFAGSWSSNLFGCLSFIISFCLDIILKLTEKHILDIERSDCLWGLRIIRFVGFITISSFQFFTCPPHGLFTGRIVEIIFSWTDYFRWAIDHKFIYFPSLLLINQTMPHYIYDPPYRIFHQNPDNCFLIFLFVQEFLWK